MTVEVRPVAYEETLFAPMVSEAEFEGAAFLPRLRDEWLSGVLRFDGAGEVLLGAFLDGEFVGVGGISLDPYHPAPGLGRIRHVYVLRRHRRRGVARLLMARLLVHARGRFSHLRLNTQNVQAARLYESLGFAPSARPRETHRLRV